MALLEDRYPAFKFANVGDTIEGTILSVSELDDRDLDSGQTKTWPGTTTPVKVWVLAVQPDDGETRAVWVRGNLVKAFRAAAQEAGVKAPEGAKVKIRFDSLGEAKKGLNPAKLFKVRITPGVPPATSSLVSGTEDDLEDPF